MNKPSYPRRLSCRRLATLALLFVAFAPLGGCANYFIDQVEVPGTNQRLIVGHDNWPFRKAWVLEDGTLHKLKIIRK